MPIQTQELPALSNPSKRFALLDRLPLRLIGILLCCFASTALFATPLFQQSGNVLVLSNANVRVEFSLSSGRADFFWRNAKKISGFYSGVKLNSGFVTGTNYTGRTWKTISSNQVLITETGPGLSVMKQYFTLDQDDSFLTRVEMTGVGLSANWMSPLIIDSPGGVDLGSYGDDRALFVPFDNDHFVSYNSESINGSDTGNEVGAFYDNVSRAGLIIGSVTHDKWKTGVYWSGSNNRLDALKVFGGLTSHWTWDVMPHGSISGLAISSPTIFVGFGDDWRTMMEKFADENLLFAPRLAWTNGVPFGWNSWGVTNYQSHLSYANAIAVADSIHTNLQRFGFTNDGTVYVNLDSYWNNLWTDYGGTLLKDFVDHCHANGEKAGIYFTPFAYWGNANDATNYWVPVGFPPDYSKYRFSDILLRDGNRKFISNDGALAIDPTHPGTKGYIDYYTHWFRTWGFDFVKLDFLSHGALEGVHYDTNVTTGIEAYNQGMHYLLNDLGSMFVSESIAPLFPYQYAHSRRIACDAQASKINDTAYTMNAVSLGWWLDRLYSFNDPDLLVFDNGPDSNEVQSRLINGVVTGLMLNGSVLTNAASISVAQTCLTNPAINAVARVGKTFRPVDGATGTGAATVMSRQDGELWDIAVFNYNSNPKVQAVDLSLAGLPQGVFAATNLWDGSLATVSNSWNVTLNAKQAKLFRLALVSPPPSPQIIGAKMGDGNTFSFSGSNGIPGWNYVVLSSTNAGLPLSQWQPIETNSFDASGDFHASTFLNPGKSATYYRLGVTFHAPEQ